jgi:hypothetical protein
MAARFSPTFPGSEQAFPNTDTLTEDDAAGFGRRATAARTTRPLPSARPACPGRVSWMTHPGWEVRECALPRGHGGDHRDAAGYPWNDARWSD